MSRVPDAEVRVLVVDDQEPFRRAMTAVVEETDGFVVVGSATTGEESTRARVANVQATFPVADSRARIILSRPPTITRPPVSAGDE